MSPLESEADYIRHAELYGPECIYEWFTGTLEEHAALAARLFKLEESSRWKANGWRFELPAADRRSLAGRMLAAGCSTARIARSTGMSDGTIRAWSRELAAAAA